VAEEGRKKAAAPSWKRAGALVLAGVTFLLAVLGVFLPILPTTPFLLLTSWLLLRASPRLRDRLHRSQTFGPFLRDWDKYHGVRLHVKLTAVAVVVLLVGGTLIWGDLAPAAIWVLVVAAVVGLVVVLRLKLIREAP
jgi:uncharacterized protein